MWNPVFGMRIAEKSARDFLHHRVASLGLTGEITYCGARFGPYLPLWRVEETDTPNLLSRCHDVLHQVRSTHSFHLRIGQRIDWFYANNEGTLRVIYAEALGVGDGLSDLISEIEGLAKSAHIKIEPAPIKGIPIARWQVELGDDDASVGPELIRGCGSLTWQRSQSLEPT